MTRGDEPRDTLLANMMEDNVCSEASEITLARSYMALGQKLLLLRRAQTAQLQCEGRRVDRIVYSIGRSSRYYALCWARCSVSMAYGIVSNRFKEEERNKR